MEKRYDTRLWLMIRKCKPILPTAALVTNVFSCMVEAPQSCISCVSIAMVSWRSIIHFSHLREQIEIQVVWQDALTIVQMDTYIAMLELREWRRVQKRTHMLKLIMMITYYDTVVFKHRLRIHIHVYICLVQINAHTDRRMNKKKSFNVNQFKQKPFTEINISSDAFYSEWYRLVAIDMCCYQIYCKKFICLVSNRRWLEIWWIRCSFVHSNNRNHSVKQFSLALVPFCEREANETRLQCFAVSHDIACNENI